MQFGHQHIPPVSVFAFVLVFVFVFVFFVVANNFPGCYLVPYTLLWLSWPAILSSELYRVYRRVMPSCHDQDISHDEHDDHRTKMIMTIMKIKLNMVIMMINIRCVHLALMISLCFSSIINAMYLVALDTIIIILNLE